MRTKPKESETRRSVLDTITNNIKHERQCRDEARAAGHDMEADWHENQIDLLLERYGYVARG